MRASPLLLLLMLVQLHSRVSAFNAQRFNASSEVIETTIKGHSGRTTVFAFSSIASANMIRNLKSRLDEHMGARLYFYTYGYPSAAPFRGDKPAKNISDFFELEEGGEVVMQLEMRTERVRRALADEATRKYKVTVNASQIHLMHLSLARCILKTDSKSIEFIGADLRHFPLKMYGNIEKGSTMMTDFNRLLTESSMQLECKVQFVSQLTRDFTLNLPQSQSVIVNDTWIDSGNANSQKVLQLEEKVENLETRLQKAEQALFLNERRQLREQLKNFTRVTKNGKSYIVLQQRVSDSFDFKKNWKAYEEGFGDSENFWIGLRKIFLLTSAAPKELGVELESFEGRRYSAFYSDFRVLGPETNYQMTYHKMTEGSGFKMDSLLWHKNMKFSTWDNDNDLQVGGNCAAMWKSGWWFNNCFQANPNGKYHNSQQRDKQGIVWSMVSDTKLNDSKNYKKVRLLLREE